MKNETYLRIPTIFNIAEMEQNIGKAKTQNNNTSSNINKIKGISSCFHCQENNIIYDEDRDEIYCHECGTVLRQGLTDYTPNLGAFQPTNVTKKRKEILKSLKKE